MPHPQVPDDAGAMQPMSARSSVRGAGRGSGRRSARGSDEVVSRKARSCTAGASTRAPSSRASAHTPVDQDALSESRWAMPVPRKSEQRAATAGKRPSAGGAAGDLLENLLKPGFVEPPWGARRANSEQPQWDEVVRRKKMYCDYLDNQATAKQDRKLQLQRENKLIDMTTTTGLESQHREWGAEAAGIVALREAAGIVDYLAVTDGKVRKASLEKDAERQEYMRWCAEEDVRFQKMSVEKQERSKQEAAKLAENWRNAAASRQGREEADRARILKVEQAMNKRIQEGMQQDRRRRRPKDMCLPDHPW